MSASRRSPKRPWASVGSVLYEVRCYTFAFWADARDSSDPLLSSYLSYPLLYSPLFSAPPLLDLVLGSLFIALEFDFSLAIVCSDEFSKPKY